MESGLVAPFSVVPLNTTLRLHSLELKLTGSGQYQLSAGSAVIGFRHDFRKSISSTRVDGQIQTDNFRMTSATPLAVLGQAEALDGRLLYTNGNFPLSPPIIDTLDWNQVWGELEETSSGALGAPSPAVDRVPVWCGSGPGNIVRYQCTALDHSIPNFSTVPDRTQLRVHRIHAFPESLWSMRVINYFYFNLGGSALKFAYRPAYTVSLSAIDSGGRPVGASLYGPADNRIVSLNSATPLLVIRAGAPLDGYVGVNEVLVDQSGHSANYDNSIRSDEHSLWGELLIER